MNIGNIPGYYYDEEKKKYFKIQANHVAPIGAKYAKTRVKREKQEAKKRKSEIQKRQTLESQTLRRSSVLNHAFAGGLGLRREHGDRFRVSYSDSSGSGWPRDDAIVAGLCGTAAHVKSPVPPITDIIFFEDHEQVLIVNVNKAIEIRSRTWIDTDAHRSLTAPKSVIEYNALVTSVSTQFLRGTIAVLIYTDAHNGDGACYYIRIRPDGSCYSDRDGSGLDHLRTFRRDPVWATALNPITGAAAVASSQYLFTWQWGLLMKRQLQVESRAVDWVNAHVLAYGQHDHRDKAVKLFDLRTPSHGYRSTHEDVITGIRNTDDSGLHLLVSDNRKLSYYDTRSFRAPLFSCPHVHEGPQLDFTANPAGTIVAAIDQYHTVQLYSVRSGRRTGTLKQVPDQPSLLARLRWHEDANGRPTIRACSSGRLIEWTWGGVEDDEAAV